MRKIGLLCLAVVLVLGTIGAGFAWWAEKLDIGENTVNTGELDVDWGPGPVVGDVHLYIVRTGTVSPDGSTMTLTMNNMYPGGVVVYHNAVYNNGTIPVKITGYTVTKTDGSDDLWAALQVQYNLRHLYGASEAAVDNVLWMDIAGWETRLNAYGKTYKTPPGPYSTSYVVLKPGDRLDFGEDSILFRVNPNAGNGTENLGVTFTVTVNFTQFNAP